MTVPEELDPESVPDHIRAAARLAPGQWIGLVDPTWQGEGLPPSWAVVGQWRAGADGGIEEFAPNEEYRSSPLAHEWPAPADPVDAAVQLSATGYGPPEEIYRALASARVAVLLDEYGTVGGFELPDGGAAVIVFSAPSLLADAGTPDHVVLGAGEVMDLLPAGHGIMVNPGAPAAIRLEPATLWDFLDERARTGGSEHPLRPFG
ncbi:type VII secretion system-associated protein [Kitasatospora sp. NPDC008050]|uniref:type VII secretion system-associated protein n=1 Tax=Kitasatospora sp. NPDC008050 TaxID=3364021 RepID=UPI0036E08C08